MNYILDFRRRSVGGAVVPGQLTLAESDIAGLPAEDRLRSESRITFLLHGFNVDRTSGREKLLGLAERLPAAAGGAVVAVLWPGDHRIGPLSYSFEGRDADDTAVHLSRFITRVVLPGTPLYFVSHSLGARVILETLQELPEGDYPIGQLCLMAAAIDDFSLAAPQGYRMIVQQADRLAVLSSTREKVLKWAYPAGDLLQAFVFFWREMCGLALGYHGPKPYGGKSGAPVPDNVLHEPIPRSRKSDHGHYLPDPGADADEARNQLSAAQFSNAVIAGEPDPEYR